MLKRETRDKSRARAQAILLNSQGIKIPEIAKILDVSQKTLYRWFNRFDKQITKTTICVLDNASIFT
ncbi:MAG TPA: helix-turn-helix domain-containing protein [Sulfurimonas autotrophica]|nr:helix-turn-helix domain-containing protein [Sulfurimonas autotrophica]